MYTSKPLTVSPQGLAWRSQHREFAGDTSSAFQARDIMIWIGGCQMGRRVGPHNTRLSLDSSRGPRAGQGLAQRPREGPTWAALERFLLRESPDIHRQLDPVAEDGFTVVGGDYLTVWLRRRPKGCNDQIEALKTRAALKELTLRAEANVNILSGVER